MTEPLQDVDPATAAQMIDAGTASLIDVREDDEWAAGHAPKAVHVPLGDLDPSAHADGGPLVVVCRSGGRSSKAAAKLATAGLAVHNLSGGMTAWGNAGQPVLRDDGTPGTVI
ncbi:MULTISPECIES: rhodanese-like domain-containing protein [Mycobacteriaceae]|jgi:rhodanese-related sulfurtransferase|uniref:Thiosulfate sulfurtransferase n=2 Tax=Mycolicibacterium TaxID=1866885 RepID=A0A178LL46_MYCIR|nr:MULTISPECIES: rhodanese-like domain-containing protein [Mycobacteriaceae]OAN31052.1 thiosulfate sulfurtransferase [Mycolicibacterium iranicum]OPX08269.1 thiosulfate sulfurtransferase [Mycobacterium sp. AT1]TQR87996.1 rhodanese-like domain-containing protein [Mycolicibacterium hodleri]